MDGLAWTATAIRLMAVWLVVEVLLGLPAFLTNWFSTADFGEQARFISAALRANVVSQVAALALAALLWFQSANLARQVWVPHLEQDLATGHVSAGDLQQAALIGVGAYLVVFGLPNLIELAASYYALPAGFEAGQEFSGRLARAIGAAIQIAAGLGMAFGSHGIVNLLRRVRSSGRDVDAEDDPDA